MKTIPEILASIRPEVNFADSNDFIADELLDSFDLITLVSELDREYAISIPGEEIVPENFKNESAIRSLVQKLTDKV